MKYTEAQYGRIFILRLEDKEILHETVETFAAKKGIDRAAVIFVGGADEGSRIITGPRQGRSTPIEPMEHVLDNVYEAAGVGTIFPDSGGKPVLHMHASFGRKDTARTGCVRSGVGVWHIGEIIIYELTGNNAIRKKDETTGFELLEP